MKKFVMMMMMAVAAITANEKKYAIDDMAYTLNNINNK